MILATPDTSAAARGTQPVALVAAWTIAIAAVATLTGPQLIRYRIGHPGGRYRVDRACVLAEQLRMQVSAAFRPRLGLLDADPVGFGPRVLADAGDLSADLYPARVGADGELVVLDLLGHHGAGELTDHGELVAEVPV